MFGGKLIVYLFKYSNSDQAEDHADIKLISRFVFTLNRKPISYSSKKQAVVALLSFKAKYVNLNLVVQETIWLRLLSMELRLLQSDDQFVEIQVYKSNNCINTILPSAKKYQKPDNKENFINKQRSIFQKSNNS